MALPVRTRARREKSEWRSAGFSNTRWYSSIYRRTRPREPPKHQDGEESRERRRRYQFGETPLGEDSSRTRQMEMSGDPASHVEPVHRSSGWGPVLSVQQHQLLLGADGAPLQHSLQLKEPESMKVDLKDVLMTQVLSAGGSQRPTVEP